MTYLTKGMKNELLMGAATEITNRYYEMAADLIEMVGVSDSIFVMSNSLGQIFFKVIS